MFRMSGKIDEAIKIGTDFKCECRASGGADTYKRILKII